MEKMNTKQASLALWIGVLFLQNLAFPVFSSASLVDQKNYYSPDPHTSGSPPSGSHHSPSHASHHHHSPSHGSHHSPPANCGNPPSGGQHYDPTPSTPPSGGGSSYSPPSSGGGYSYSPPSSGGSSYSPPSSGGSSFSPPSDGGSPPSDGGSPPSSGGGYSYSPPSSDGGYSPSIPSPIVDLSPPSIDPGTGIGSPIVPGIGSPLVPGISTPSPPFAFDPSSPPFTCNIWGSHPTLIWGVLGYWGTVGGLFGASSFPSLAGSNMSLQQALLNSRSDPIGALYREGTASLLNSMATKKFPYTTNQVRDKFVSALSSNKAAAAQAHLFKLANEGRIIPRA